MMLDAVYDNAVDAHTDGANASDRKTTLSRKHHDTMPRHLSMPGKALGGKQVAWSPYMDNGGTCAAIAGKGFVAIAGDTRLSGYGCINTRDDRSKLVELSNSTVMASGGMQADRLQLQQILKFRLQWYKFNNNKEARTPAIAQLLSSILYGRRFFPLYTFNIVAGLDANGDGVCYSYDAVGCTEPLRYGVTGSGEPLVEPLLDCMIRRPNQVGSDGSEVDMTPEQAVSLLKDAFNSACERDVNTGDALQIKVVTRDGVRTEIFPLRRD